jgi:hypothetical protein
MSYIITGPTTIGTTGQLNNFLGNVRLTDIGTTWGDIFFAGQTGPGNLEALVPGTPGQVLQTNGAGADPSWVNNSATLMTNGFSVGKTGADTFTDTAIQIQNWATTAPAAGLSVNPFYNTGGPDFNATTGVYTPSTTGVYIVDAYIEYSNTSPAHGSLKTLTFVQVNSGPANGVIISCGPRQGSGNVASTEVLHIHQSVKLNSGSTYALRIVASTSDVTNTMLASSRFSINLLSV